MKGLAFYEAAAQVIPILFLVTAIEGRDMATAWPFLTRSWRFLTLALLAFIAVGEWRALHVLYVEDAAPIDPWLVGTTIAALANAMIFASTGHPFVPTKKLPTAELEDLQARIAALRRDIEEEEATGRPSEPEPTG